MISLLRNKLRKVCNNPHIQRNGQLQTCFHAGTMMQHPLGVRDDVVPLCQCENRFINARLAEHVLIDIANFYR